jgi:exonuclease VII small subunit
MGLLSERLQFILQLDADGAIKGFERVGQAADKNIGKADDRLNKLSARMTKVGATLTASSGVAAVGLFKLGTAADELNAAGSAMTQVLGESAEAVDRWAEGSVKAVGLSKRSALDAATSFGAIGKSAGFASEELSAFAIQQVELAADMAAFKNVAPTEALADLQSGYAGQTEVLRKYSIFLDDVTLKNAYFRETGEKVTGTLTAQQRVVATHAEIMRQSADMQGQWNREIGSAASQQAMLKAELENLAAGIGEGVLPAMQQLLGAANGVFGAIGNLDSGMQKGIGTFATYATATAGAVGALSFLGGQALKMRDHFTTVGEDGSRSLNKLGTAAGTIGAAGGMFALAGAIDQVVNESYNLGNAVEQLSQTADDELIESLRTMRLETAGVVSEQELLETVAKHNIGTAERLADKMDEQGISSEALRAAIADQVEAQRQQNADAERGTQAIDGTADAAGDAAGEQLGLAQATRVSADAARDQASAFRAMMANLYGAGDRARDADEAIADYSQAVSGAGSSSSSAARSIDLVAEKEKAVAAAAKDAEQALESYESSTRSLRDAQESLADAQTALDEALQGPSERDKAKAANDQSQANLDLAKANEALAEKQKKLEAAERAGNPARIADARREVEEATLAQERATWQLEDATLAYQEAANWSAESDPKVAAARDQVADAQERVELAARESTKRYQELQDAQTKQGEVQGAALSTFGDTSAALGTQRDRVHEVKDAYNDLRDAIIRQIEATLAAQVSTARTIEELDALEKKVNAIPGLTYQQRFDLKAAIYAGKVQANQGYAPGDNPYGYAAGTPSFAPGDWRMVGENGRELMRRTPTGFEVIDAGRTRSMMQQGKKGGDVTVVLNGASVSPHDVAREVAWQIRTN